MSSPIKDKIQTQVVELISKGLESGEISESRAREIAKLVLEKLPDNLTEEEMMLIIPKLDDEFRELSEIVMPIMQDYEARIRAAVEKKILDLARARKFQEAIDLAKKAIALSSQLT